PHETLINLASQEYFKVIQAQHITCRIITPVFKENKLGTYKVIGIFAKRARGLMARYIIQQRISQVEHIQGFAVDGYAFNPTLSDAKHWVFSRG
ncbi:MAG: peroxide stress protein YaaA, partial [Mariprofundaceae bacterium]|nr:peroxide stress protein YaaA [Mariprofundaceae bacterium]